MMLDLPVPPKRASNRSELQELEYRLWRELAVAASQTGHPWRTPVLATVSPDGFPDARSVVLREIQAETRELRFYSDERSPKIAQLRAQPQASLVMWSPELGWQLRIKLECSVQTTGLAVMSRWARLKMTPAAQDYLSPLPPGSNLSQEPPDRDTREHFAVVTGRVACIDWLALDREGHRRALFETGQPARWVQP